jgi:mono/diheme cytochrome c family protein
MRFDYVSRHSRNRAPGVRKRPWKLALVLSACAAALSFVGNTRAVNTAGTVAQAGPSTADAAAMFQQYCVQCHKGASAKAGVNLEQLTAAASFGEHFQQWEKVATALEQQTMPPKFMPQPSDAERGHAAAWIRAGLRAYAEKHDGDPGPVTVRRLTSGEYAYAVKDLTGLDLNVGIDATTDSVGGEGFTNFGDVQFMQDANLERYLGAAKLVAEHAVIGSGPLEFFAHPGKTGFELSAVTRIKDIYAAHGIRTVSGEGGRPFGLEKYGQALFVAWQYKHRAALGEAGATLKDLAAREGVNLRFAEHIWRVVNKESLGYPSSEVAAKWRQLPAPGSDGKAAAAGVRAGCEEIQKFIVTWPSWLFARGDLAAGGAGDESPLEFSDRTLSVKPVHRFAYVRGGRGPVQSGPAKIYLNVAVANPAAGEKPLVIWRNLTVGFRPFVPRTPVAAGQSAVATAQELQAAENLRRGILPPGPRQTLRSLVSAETAERLNFGKGPAGVTLGPDDFVSEGSTMFEVPMPEGRFIMNLQVDAELAGNRDQVVRVVIADRADGMTRGQPTRALIGDMKSAGYKAFRAGVMEFASLLPPNSHGEPTPADKDPVPDPFDNTYNVPEHDEFVQKVKYVRDDRFLAEHLVDEATRRRLDQAWNDLYASFEYHDNYLRLLAKHFGHDLKGKGIADMNKAQIAALPAEMRKYVTPLRANYDAVTAAQAAARPGHVKDCLEFASRAWRRPLTEKEKQGLRAFYDKTLSAAQDHRKAVRALLARILVAPQFLYRVEQGAGERAIGRAGNSSLSLSVSHSLTSPPSQTLTVPLSNWEVASRLSFFLWASIPDDELRRAAGAGELTDPAGIRRQVKRMVADPKARRLSTEFFGQWLGFYHFDQYKGVDTSRFTDFTDDVREAMYDEAVSFFEHVIRKDRPVREMLFADYTFLNKDLAKFYGVKKEVKSAERVELVEGANAFNRGGLLRLGAVLTATSAPLRTSPVKRGDWILRRVLGTPTPPPPADAGSLPADDKLFGGLSLKAKLEQHKRNPSCANCHTRIDPLGFSLERYDPTGRWRDKYPDGNAIEDSAALPDKTEVAGVDGLLAYLRSKEAQVRRTLSAKLVGYALGRTVLASDQLLIERMVQAGGDATFAELAAEVAASKQFRTRLARDESPTSVPKTAPAKPPTTTKVALNSDGAARKLNQGVGR